MNDDESTAPKFTGIGVTVQTKDEFKAMARERKRNISDIAAAAIKAFKRLPRDQQDALIEGRKLTPSAA